MSRRNSDHCVGCGRYPVLFDDTINSDGSIEAQFPEGMLRFGSITKLRNHIEQSA
jgi:hypothetical protein